MIKKLMFHINSLGKGGAERVIVNLTAEFLKLGIDVAIATEWTAADEYPMPEGARRINVGLTETEESLSRFKKLTLRTKKLKQVILAEKPDVVVSFTRNSNYRATMAAKGTKVPVVFSVRSDPATDYGSKAHKFLGNHLYKKTAGGVFQTQQALEYFDKKIGDKSTVILNPLNTKFLNLSKPAKRRKVITTAGRFNVAKDQITLVKAFERIMDKYPDYKLELFGDRSEDNTFDILSDYVRKQGLQDRVLFMGNSNELEKIMIDAAVFVLSSKYEGMPNALMEAMAMGLPVVSTDCPCGGPDYLINDGENGFLVPVGDDEKMAEKISYLIDHPEEAEAMGDKAKAIADQAKPEVIAKTWIDFIEKAIG